MYTCEYHEYTVVQHSHVHMHTCTFYNITTHFVGDILSKSFDLANRCTDCICVLALLSITSALFIELRTSSLHHYIKLHDHSRNTNKTCNTNNRGHNTILPSILYTLLERMVGTNCVSCCTWMEMKVERTLTSPSTCTSHCVSDERRA